MSNFSLRSHSRAGTSTSSSEPHARSQSCLSYLNRAFGDVDGDPYYHGSKIADPSRNRRLSFLGRPSSVASDRPTSTSHASVLGRRRGLSRAEAVSPSPADARGSSAQLGDGRIAGESSNSIKHALFRKRKSIPNRKTPSISLPFNFQHVTHTSKSSLLKPDNRDDEDRPMQFSAITTSQQPISKPSSTQANMVDSRRSRSSSDRPVPVSTPRALPSHSKPLTSPNAAARVDGPASNKMVETKVNPGEDHVLWKEVVIPTSSSVAPDPKPPFSSTGALSPKALPEQSSTLPTQHFPNQGKQSPVSPATRPVSNAGIFGDKAGISQKDFAAHFLPLARHEITQGQRVKERQPLPAIPPPFAAKAWDASAQVMFSYQPFPTPLKTKLHCATPALPKPKRSPKYQSSTRSLRSACSCETDIWEDPTWEDDIDFAYEHEAEGRCDFVWEIASSPLVEQDEDSDSAEGSASESADDVSTLSSRRDDSRGNRSCKSSLSNLDITGDADSVLSDAVHHRRGSSVGHKGFAAARNVSQDTVACSRPPLNLTGSRRNTPTEIPGRFV